MSSVTTPKPLTAMIVERFLPIASAKWPKMKAPIGRPISVAAKIEPDHDGGRGRAKLRRHEVGYGGRQHDYGQIDVEHVDEEPEESPPYGILRPRVQFLLPPSACRSSHVIPPSRAFPGRDPTKHDTPVSFEYHSPLTEA